MIVTGSGLRVVVAARPVDFRWTGSLSLAERLEQLQIFDTLNA